MSDRIGLAEYIVGRMEKESPKKLSKDIADYLLKNKKAADIESLIRDCVDIRASQGIIEVKAVSRYPLTAANMSELKKVIKSHYKNAKKIIINPSISEEIIGGVRLFIGNDLLDLSLNSKLNKFRELTTN